MKTGISFFNTQIERRVKMAKFMYKMFVIAGVVLLSVSLVQAAEPKRGGTLICGLSGEPATMTAHMSTDTSAMMVANNIFSALIGFDMDFKPTPELAESWTVSDDGLTYTFNMVKNAKWHDGKPVTAEDVEFTFNEIIAKVHPRSRSWWPNVESAKATGKYTFVIKLKSVYAPFITLLGSLCTSGTQIMPKHIYKGTDPKTNPANMAPIGCGPFKFKKWVRGSHIELVRNDNFFKKGKPYLDRVIFQVAPDAAARLLAFEQGDIDFLQWYIVPHDQVDRLRKDPRFKIVPKGGEAAATSEFLLFNHRNKYLKDSRVRQAIAYALDRKEIQDKSLFGEGKVARSHINSGLGWVYTDEFDYKQNVDKANQLLDEAGFPRGSDGKRFSLRESWSAGRVYEGRAAEVIRDQLKAVGIDIKIETFDRPTFIDRVFRKWDFDIANQLFTTGPDPTISVTVRYHTKQIKKAPFVNGMGYSNSELDNIFDNEYKELDRTKRREMWIQAQKILMRDLPGLPLFEMPVVQAVSAKFNDVVTTPYGYVESRENAYLVK
jgi:peptide/nickel transport system substrate-binding protein